MDKLEAQKQKSAEKRAKRAARTALFTNSPSSPSMKFSPLSILDLEASTPTNGMAIYHATVFNNTEDDNRQQSCTGNKLDSEFRTPIAPPRSKHEEARKTAEKARQDARARARLKSDEDLGLSPEDRLRELRMKVARRQLKSEMDDEETTNLAKSGTKRYSFGNLYRSPSSVTPDKLQTSKSTDNFNRASRCNDDQESTAKSLDELLAAESPSRDKDVANAGGVVKRDKTKKSKDPERRKSIIQAVSDFFKRKDSLSPPKENNKLSMFRLTPKSKEKGKVRFIIIFV